MARNGSGVYALPSPENPVVASTLITAAKFNTTMTDIGTALTGSIAADGQTTVTANIPMNSNKLTGLGAATADGDAPRLQQTLAAGVGADIASATALPVDISGIFHDVTGTTTITSFAATTGGRAKFKVLQFDGALTLTHHATDLVLPGGVNITTYAGYIATFYEYASGDWRLMSQSKPLLTSATAQATTSGTTIDFTSIPVWAKRITLMFSGVSSNLSDNSFLVQIGDSGGLETSGYAVKVGGTIGNTAESSTAGFVVTDSTPSTTTINGAVTLTLLDAATNNWVCAGVLSASHSELYVSGGSKALTGTLDRIRLTTVLANTLNAGQVNILYE